MGVRDGESFLTRWARLKRRAGQPPQDRAAQAPEVPAATQPMHKERASASEQSPAPQVASRDPGTLSESDFLDVDFDALDINSDYTRFMQAGVPDAIRQKALRKLWACDPVLSMPDGLNDYMGDYTDAAVAAPPGNPLTTAYRIGRGFLDDREVAEWEALGRPATASAAAGDTHTDAATSALAEGDRSPTGSDGSRESPVAPEKALEHPDADAPDAGKAEG
jgi:hypothetical protein